MAIEKLIIKTDEYTTTNWSGGTTTELFIYPKDSKYKELDFKFRISSATVELDQSEFTTLDKVYRFIAPLDNILKLTHDGQEYIQLNPYQVYEFKGDIKTTSIGKAKDFNLMIKDGANGSLESIKINDEYIIDKTLKVEKEYFYFIYSNEFGFNVDIGNEIYTINPQETFLVNLKNEEKINLKINSTHEITILIAKINL